MNDAWLKREIASGLQALVALSLEGQPAAEVLPLTADIWLQALSGRMKTEELDAPRLKQAFARLFPILTRWPTPKQVLDLLPDRPEVKKLPAPEITPEQHAENVARIREMVNGLLENWSGGRK